jgi:glycosyltransferase involved in cell wall biosynthesis
MRCLTFLIPSRAPEVIREAVLTLLADAERRKSMGEAGRASVLGERYVKERVLGLAVEFYLGLLKGTH